MSGQEIFGELVPTDEVTFQRTLSKLLDRADVELKTEIMFPREITLMCVWAEYLAAIGLSKSANATKDFVTKYLVHMCSYKRKRSEEIVRGVIGAREAEREATRKAMQRFLGVNA